jgi:hypothetical protein
MIYIWAFLIAGLCVAAGIYVGSRLNREVYHGVMVVEETPEGVKFRLELAGDPELLIFQDSVTFKVLPPNYEDLISRGKPGV